LRNPLAPIRNAVQILHMRGPEEPELQKSRDIIDRQARHLTRLVDDLLDVSRISRGRINLQKQRSDLSPILTNAVEASRPLIEAHRHEFTLTLPPAPVYVEADTTRLAQVFSNLLNNAAKYTEPGGHIWLVVERQGSDVVVTVKDNGTGIPADQLPTLFEMFSQVEGSLPRAQGGLGIGLHLVKRLVEMHGGSVTARSEGAGKGSEFVVRLPVIVEASGASFPTKEDEPTIPKSSLRILIVDDNWDGADTLGMMLRLMGNDIRTAYDGEEAITAAEEFRPDVVLLDIGLPKLNGYEACRQIREQPWSKGMVLIAVTGWGQEEARRRSHEAGFDKHMVKPVDPQALMKMLAGLEDAARK
jgi:CheY-like chemotaxis protein/two-component sensor histidine kinase